RNARPASSQDCTFLGRRPSGFCALSCSWGVSTIARASVSGVPREGEFAFTNGQVARVDDFWGDIDAVLELERNQVRLSVLDFVESGLFARSRADVGEAIVVIDRRYEKWCLGTLCVEGIVEDEFRGV